MATVIDRRVFAGVIAARLTTVTNAAGYYGQIGRALPGQTIGTGTGHTPADPQPKGPHDLRVRPYIVLFPGAGTDGPDTDVADTFVDLDAPFQVTVAGGDIDDVLALATRVDTALNRWTPPPTGGMRFGRLAPPAGYDPGPVLTDASTKPARLYTPLLYRAIAHT
ncbi:hypothetical protein [Nocardioides sp. Arc9.136]|uniref:hypothetical protein n=1 Tax=Nocardioides sp. Arc9.136 TaxID=2996826 RepID=UPI0026651BC6|nr:hypothetical protein [Nocardioides sp. Arc9.136]WKN47148.1 hypothetical protein OSR43_13980 [Nocardioides sp. Arc9.136]